MTEPSLESFGLTSWKILSDNKTPVQMLSSRCDTIIRLAIQPVEKLGVCRSALTKISADLSACKEMPKVGATVVYLTESSVAVRCTVVRHVSKTVAVIRDLDTLSLIQFLFNQLKQASLFLRNLPVYTKEMLFDGFTDCNPVHAELVKTFFDQDQENCCCQVLAWWNMVRYC